MSRLSFCTNKASWFACFFLVIAMAASGTVRAEDPNPSKTVVVIGTGAIYKNDSATARETAISNSLESAVDMVAVHLLPLESIIRSFQTVNDVVGGKTSDFIQDYKVLAEFSSEDKYRVMVEATVSTQLLETKLQQAGLFMGKKEMPKILFLVSEQNLEDILPKYWWRKDWIFYQAFSEKALADVFQTGGFKIISHDNMILDNKIDTTYDKPELSDQQAVNLGALLQADVVIVGKAFVHQAPNVLGTDIRSFQGTVTARAVRVDTGAQIAAASESAVTANSEIITGCQNALSDAGGLAAKQLVTQITTAWQHEEKPLNTVTVMLDGTANLANFVKFRNVLQDLPGVKEMQIQEMKADQAIIMISFQGTAKELADALILKTFESIGINIYEVSENHLRIELISG